MPRSAVSNDGREPARPTTMRDIATRAGVAQSTVSRVLNSAPSAISIAPATRERVLSAAANLDYRPNPLARALRGAPTMLLGVIVRDITDPFFAIAVEALSTEARSRGYNVVLGHAHGKADEAAELASVLEARHCDAIVLLGDMTDQPRLIDDLRLATVPVVGLWQGSHVDGLPTVNVDNAMGIQLAVGHLVGLGHRRVAFLGGRPLGDIEERRVAFVESAAAAGLELPPGYVHHAANTPAGGKSGLAELLALPTPPTAVVFATDVLAIGALSGAYEAGIRVPQDLSVTGFDDIPFAAYSVPALTTVQMPVAAMIAEAARMAIDEKVRGTERGRRPAELVGVTLVIRKSTAAAPDR